MSDQIGFNYIPGSGLTAPLFTFEVNSGGQYASTTRLVLIGHKTSAGSLAYGVQTPVASQAQADALSGPGSMLREMFRVAQANAPAQPIWLDAVAEIGTAAVWTIAIGALPAGGGVATLKVCGEQISITVLASDTPATLAANLAAALNGFYNTLTNAMLPVTAVANGSNVVVTARHAGQIMNDVTFYVPPNISGNVLSTPGVYALTATAPGVGTPDLSVPLGDLGDQPADFIVSPWSDANSLTLYTEATNDVSGRWAWSRQSYGHVFSVYTGSFAGAVTLGLTLNDRHTTLYRRLAGTPTPSWLWAAGMTARVAPWLSDCVLGNVSRNQTGLIVEGILPPWDLTTLDNYTGRNTLLNSGLSTFSVDASGNVCIDKIISTYRTGVSGQPDTVFRDIQSLFQVSGGLSYLRALLAQQCGQKALANSNPGNLAAIVTPSDIKATYIAGYTDLCDNGVFQDADTYARTIVAKINSQNPDRCDVYSPMERVNPLDILAANATIYQRYPASA